MPVSLIPDSQILLVRWRKACALGLGEVGAGKDELVGGIEEEGLHDEGGGDGGGLGGRKVVGLDELLLNAEELVLKAAIDVVELLGEEGVELLVGFGLFALGHLIAQVGNQPQGEDDEQEKGDERAGLQVGGSLGGMRWGGKVGFWEMRLG